MSLARIGINICFYWSYNNIQSKRNKILLRQRTCATGTLFFSEPIEFIREPFYECLRIRVEFVYFLGGFLKREATIVAMNKTIPLVANF